MFKLALDSSPLSNPLLYKLQMQIGRDSALDESKSNSGFKVLIYLDRKTAECPTPHL